MKRILNGPLGTDRVKALRQLNEAVRELLVELAALEDDLTKVLPHFKEWTFRRLDMKPIWWNFEELYKADYHGTDQELYEVIVSPEWVLQVTRLWPPGPQIPARRQSLLNLLQWRQPRFNQ